ncbi:hypothetical protein DUI87_23287 [Hirundo rustica rustica]|uniref:Reverse transcriptase domain-containing protein n=1 Tax=Hirundo rustica rustica TaxID=333673 RepID=A0A3M0JIP9_HIRRU|nr:hypothetical protein DUI87_23287 [Hirundo rustica rustica]
MHTSLWGHMESTQEILRELTEKLDKTLFIIYVQFWLSKKVSQDWKLANVIPIYKKGWKDNRRNYWPVSLTLVTGKVMKQNLSAIMWHIQDNQGIRPSQHKFMKGRSCLTDLISVYDSDPPNG